MHPSILIDLLMPHDQARDPSINPSFRSHEQGIDGLYGVQGEEIIYRRITRGRIEEDEDGSLAGEEVGEALHELHLRAEAAHVVGGLLQQVAVLHPGAARDQPPQRVTPRRLPRLPRRLRRRRRERRRRYAAAAAPGSNRTRMWR